MKRKTLILLLIVIVFTLGLTTTASAYVDPDVTFRTCLTAEVASGYGAGQIPQTYTWTTSESFYLELLANPGHSWFWPGEIMGACGPENYNLHVGEPLIAFLGPYTVTVQEAYNDSVLTLSHYYGMALDAIDFVRPPVVVGHDGLMGLFVKLQYDINDIALFNGFMDGTYSIFYRNGDGEWGPCPTILMEYEMVDGDVLDFGFAQCTVWDEVTAYAVGQE